MICGAVALNITTGAIDGLNPFRNGAIEQRTIDRAGPAVLKSITDLGDFRVASGYYELVIDVGNDLTPVPSFLAGRRVLFDRLKDAVVENPSDLQEVYTLANQRLSEAARKTHELTYRGEADARSIFEGLLCSLGFTSVTINFR